MGNALRTALYDLLNFKLPSDLKNLKGAIRVSSDKVENMIRHRWTQYFTGFYFSERTKVMYHLEIEDGDSLDWVKITFDQFNADGKKIRALLDLAIARSARNYDFQRKIWFVRADVIDAFLAGVKTLINSSAVTNTWFLMDKRTKIEPIEDFFYQTPPPTTSVALTKAELLKQLQKLLEDNGLPVLFKPEAEPLKEELKPIYRKAAMAFHPDRNSGDATRMSELNRIWSAL